MSATALATPARRFDVTPSNASRRFCFSASPSVCRGLLLLLLLLLLCCCCCWPPPRRHAHGALINAMATAATPSAAGCGMAWASATRKGSARPRLALEEKEKDAEPPDHAE